MARARNIKPSIMDNEDLAELEPITRLLFIYLWMLADREGRLEDRPKRIAAQALAYDRQANVAEMLSSLEASGFVTRYTAKGMALIQINAFAKHQSPHIRESASALPSIDQSTTKAVPSTILGDAEVLPRSPDSLIPDSLIPDSLIPDSLMGESADESAKEKKQVRKATQIPADFYPNETGVAYAENKKLSLAVELESFRNFHTAKGSTWKDWQATWRTWCDRAVEYGRGGVQPRQRGSPGYQSIHDKRAETIAILTGKKSNERTIANERDIAGESRRVAG